MSAWERLLAMFLGVTVIPLKVLYYSALFFPTIILSFIEAHNQLITPVFTNWQRLWGLSSYRELFEQVISDTVIYIITMSLMSAYLLGSYALIVIKPFFQFVFKGLQRGYNEGMNGYNELNNELRQELHVFITLNDNESNQLQEADPSFPKIKLLDADELKNAQLIIKDYSAAKPAELKSLTTKVERYKALMSSLDKVKEACKKPDFSEIENELIPYTDIITPIVLEKLYLNTDNTWRAVPVQTYISDKDTFLGWLKQNAIHPLSRDSINQPEKYNGKDTRYTWTVLTGDNCDAIELHDGAEEIRALIKVLSAKLPVVGNPGVSAPRSFFALASAKAPLDMPVDNSLSI